MGLSKERAGLAKEIGKLHVGGSGCVHAWRLYGSSCSLKPASRVAEPPSGLLLRHRLLLLALLPAGGVHLLTSLVLPPHDCRPGCLRKASLRSPSCWDPCLVA